MKNKLIFLSLSVLLVSGCVSHKSIHTKHVNLESTFSAETSVYFSYSGPEFVPFAGLASYDNLDATGSEGVLYPGDHPAVFLAAMLVHAGTVESIKESRRDEIEDQANEVLHPYLPIIQQFSYQQLLAEAVKPVLASTTGSHHLGFADELVAIATGHWVMQSSPRFFMLQDSGALVLQNAISLYQQSDQPLMVYQNVVEVISMPYQGEDPVQFWTNHNGKSITTTAQQLMSDSLGLAIEDALKGPSDDAKQQTFRFYQAGEKTYERGSLITAHYDRLTLRTLRGWIKSVPIISEDNRYLNQSDDGETIASVVRGIGVYY